MRIFLCLLCCYGCLGSAKLAAQIRIIGRIVDTAQQVLPRATAVLYAQQDSSLVGYDLSDDAGKIELSGIKPGNYRLVISFVGLENWQQWLSIDKTARELDLGDILLKSQIQLLQTAEVSAVRAPVVVRGDTLEISANLVKVQAHDAVEDLLKKMPGIELEPNGTLKAQGEEVRKILVDGKEFFGTDIKMALKILPADAVDKIQVIEKKSDKSLFSGIDDGQREKILNIKTKPDRQKANFGKSTLGFGPPKQYELQGNLSKFSPKRRITGTFSANNTNRSGNADISERSLSNAAPVPGGGLNTNVAAGLNFSKELPRKWQLYGNYRLNLSDREVERIARTERFLQNQTIISQDTSQNGSFSLLQNVSLTLESDRKDTLWGFKWLSGLSWRDGNSNYGLQSLASDLVNGPRNTSVRDNQGTNDMLSGNLELNVRKRLGKKGRNLNVDLDWDRNHNQSFTLSQSRNYFFATSTAAEREVLLHQERNTGTGAENWSLQVSFSEPLSKKISLNVIYNYRASTNQDQRLVSDIQADGTLQRNESLSNHLGSDVFRHNTTLSLQTNTKKLDVSTRLRWENTHLEGGFFLQEAAVNKQYNYLLPAFNLNYRPKTGRTLSLRLEQYLSLPSIRQLQPVPEIADALRFFIGNPNLSPELRYEGNIRYNVYRAKSGTTLFVNASGSLTTDKIQNVQEVDEELVTKTSPQNVSNDYSTNGNINYLVPVKAWGIRVNAGTDIGFSRTLTFINRVKNYTYSRRQGLQVSVSNQKQKKWEWSISDRLSFSANRYSANAALNRNFLQHTLGTYLRKPLFKEKCSLESQFNVLTYSGLGDGFYRSLPVWNLACSAYVLRGNKGQLRLSVFDVFAQNQGLNRSAQLNTLVDEQIKVLSRYVLLSFSYLARTTPKKK